MVLKSDRQSFNVWNYKPWWCQPWSIILTGIVIVGGSWLVAKVLWLTVLFSIPIAAWWFYFLVLFPKIVTESYFEDALSTRDE